MVQLKHSSGNMLNVESIAYISICSIEFNIKGQNWTNTLFVNPEHNEFIDANYLIIDNVIYKAYPRETPEHYANRVAPLIHNSCVNDALKNLE